jgi:hypothetical protein
MSRHTAERPFNRREGPVRTSLASSAQTSACSSTIASRRRLEPARQAPLYRRRARLNGVYPASGRGWTVPPATAERAVHYDEPV